MSRPDRSESLPFSKPVVYTCQHCGHEAPSYEWLDDGYRCPKCGRDYDPDSDPVPA